MRNRGLDPPRIKRYVLISLTLGWREEESLILERESGRLKSHWRLRAFLLSFVVGCGAFLFLLEGSAHGSMLG